MRISDLSSDVCSSDLRISPSFIPCAAATEALPVAIAFAPARSAAIALPASQTLNRISGFPGTWSAVKVWKDSVMILPTLSRVGPRIQDSSSAPSRNLRSESAVIGRERAIVFDYEQCRGTGKAALRPVRSEEHTSELQSLMRISYDVF